MRNQILGFGTLLLAAAGCAGPGGAAPQATLSGEAFYRERIAVPPGTRLEVVLEDISRADAPAETLGTFVVDDAGQPPYPFEIAYAPERIVDNHRYAVRARLTHEGRLLFTTDTVYPVITAGAPTEGLRLLMRSARGPRPAAAAPALANLPASFEGTLPCADCAGIDYHLDLFADGVFFLRQQYRGRPGEFDDIGRWAPSSDGEVVSLHGGREAPLRFQLLGPDELRLMDQDGQPIESDLDYSLRRSDEFAPIEPRLNLRGMYSYMADAALFTECLTGRRMPVAMEADNRALERAYLDARRQPGEALLVVVDGRIAKRPPMEGPGPVDTLVPERFVGIWPGETCGAPFAAADFTNTYWKLTRLGDDPVQAFANQREPHLVFHGEDNRLAGSDGCNRLMGSWRTEGAVLDLGRMASTMMACAEGMDQAQRFTTALGAVKRYRIVGQHLELFDAAGVMVARFEAVALR